jgi:eukaryotic-like serine/threonine-protein kinase
MMLDAGVRLGAYEIVGPVGSGGMGVVYRARDTRLGRIVAIKLAARTADPAERRRLLREAQHASALNHPNICTIYEIDEADGQPFIALEYVEGQPLQVLIPKGGLPLDAVVLFGLQIADALEHAHAHGVVHRDLKPANVVITPDRRAKVLDFGLSQRIWHEGAVSAQTVAVSQRDTVAGTIAFMAPEVLCGAAADARCDIWAFGVVLYEMATGALPFAGHTSFELSSQILHAPPAELPARVPAGLRTIVDGCLVKSPDGRYQRVADVRAALDQLRAGGATQPVSLRSRPFGRRTIAAAAVVAAVLLAANQLLTVRVLATTSVAVVPFVTGGAPPDEDYVSDGVTEGVIDKLAHVPRSSLRVIALNSVRQYKGRDVDATAVGRDLHVGAVVVGRLVRQAADRYAVTSELVNASDRSRMWGKTFTVTIAELPAVQAEIAESVSAALHVPWSAAEKQRLTKLATANVDAYRLYLKGRYFCNQYTEDGWNRSIEYFKQALEIDPAYAPAWSGLADAYYNLSSLVLTPAEAIPLARAAVTRALAIDDGLAEAHASLAVIKEQYDWDPDGAVVEFTRALELNPSYAEAHHWYGTHLFVKGLFEPALAEYTRARELDPLSVSTAVSWVWPLPHLGREDDAVREAARVAELFPAIPDVADWVHELRGEAFLRKRMAAEAVDEFVEGAKVSFLCGNDPQTKAALKQAYRTSGLSGFWRKELEMAVPHFASEVEAARRQSSRRYVSPRWLAELYARVGDTERAFALLQDAFNHRDENLRFLKVESLAAESPWLVLKSDPRFAELVRGMRLD